MIRTFWEDTGSMFDVILPASNDQVAYAFSFKNEDEIYYFSFFDIKVLGGTSTVCLITDVTDKENEDHNLGLLDFRDFCLHIQKISQRFLGTMSGSGDIKSVTEADKRKDSYTIIGKIQTLSFECEKDLTARCFDPIQIYIAPEYRGRSLVHAYFDFLTIMNWQKIKVNTTNMVVGDDEVVLG